MNEERNYVVEKKKSPILTFIVILTCVVIIGTCIYFIYNSIKIDNDNSNKEENNVNSSEVEEDNIANEEEKELEVTEEDKNLAQELVDNFSLFKDRITAGDSFGYFYNNNELLINNISNSTILEIALYQYVKEENPFASLNWGSSDSITVSSNKINNYVIDIFGKTIAYKNEDIPAYCFSGVYGLYDSNNDVYVFSRPEHGCGGMGYPIILSQINDIKKYDDRIEVIEKIVYIESELTDKCLAPVLYNHPTEKVLIESANCDNRDTDVLFDNNIDKLLSYKWTFKKDGSNYYFEKIERMN